MGYNGTKYNKLMDVNMEVGMQLINGLLANIGNVVGTFLGVASKENMLPPSLPNTSKVIMNTPKLLAQPDGNPNFVMNYKKTFAEPDKLEESDDATEFEIDVSPKPLPEQGRYHGIIFVDANNIKTTGNLAYCPWSSQEGCYLTTVSFDSAEFDKTLDINIFTDQTQKERHALLVDTLLKIINTGDLQIFQYIYQGSAISHLMENGNDKLQINTGLNSKFTEDGKRRMLLALQGRGSDIQAVVANSAVLLDNVPCNHILGDQTKVCIFAHQNYKPSKKYNLRHTSELENNKGNKYNLRGTSKLDDDDEILMVRKDRSTDDALAIKGTDLVHMALNLDKLNVNITCLDNQEIAQNLLNILNDHIGKNNIRLYQANNNAATTPQTDIATDDQLFKGWISDENDMHKLNLTVVDQDALYKDIHKNIQDIQNGKCGHADPDPNKFKFDWELFGIVGGGVCTCLMISCAGRCICKNRPGCCCRNASVNYPGNLGDKKLASAKADARAKAIHQK